MIPLLIDAIEDAPPGLLLVAMTLLLWVAVFGAVLIVAEALS